MSSSEDSQRRSFVSCALWCHRWSCWML